VWSGFILTLFCIRETPWKSAAGDAPSILGQFEEGSGYRPSQLRACFRFVARDQKNAVVITAAGPHHIPAQTVRVIQKPFLYLKRFFVL